MEKIVKLAQDTEKALDAFKKILKEPSSSIVRDAAIQRFEYCFVVILRLLREYLNKKEGIICNSPKSCLREAYSIQILNKEESISALEMTDDRNSSSNAYIEETAQKIFEKLETYLKIITKIFSHINKNLK